MPRSPTLVRVVILVLLVTACSRVQPHFALPTVTLGEPSFFPTLEAYASAPIVGGNRVDLLLNGERDLPRQARGDSLGEADDHATRSTSTRTGRWRTTSPRRWPSAAARASASTCLLDGFGTLGMPGEIRRPDEEVPAATSQPSARSIACGRAARPNNRNHRRMLVVDGRVAITGGSGVSRKWMGNGRTEDHWRDTDVRIEGPAVNYVQGAFAENWLEATGIVLGGDAYFPGPVPPPGREHVQVVRSSPAGGSFAIYTAFLLAIASARRSIYITNPYFVLDEKMTEALLAARQHGARVVVLVPGKIDHNLVRQASRAEFRQAPQGRDRDLRVSRRAPAREDDGDRRRVVHRRQHEPRQPLVRAERRAERDLLQPAGRRASRGGLPRGPHPLAACHVRGVGRPGDQGEVPGVARVSDPGLALRCGGGPSVPPPRRVG